MSNRLHTAASAYLRSAQHQPVWWHEWGTEAFAQAQHEGKPILLDIGAVWCHWCHVMDRESYENIQIADLINRHFLAIKVDRDERPDVDSRYQAAVAAISGQSGWPLTAFLTPDGRPFFGGTYFPPEDRYGRPGLPQVLRRMAEAFHRSRPEVEESAAGVLEAIEQNETFAAEAAGPLDQALLDQILTGILQQFDPRHGGFGAQPKFPHPAALDLLIDAATRPGPLAGRARTAAVLTLERMAAGGLHDHLAGGFHRYSVDERWAVPHFEKLAYDNSELLRAYTHAFQSFVDPAFARTAAAVISWIEASLSDRGAGGFYASQDADASPGDDGDFYTWTRTEAQAALTPEEFALAAAHFDLRPVGDMQHNPAKNVLHLRENAALADRPADEVRTLLLRAKAKLLAARAQRPTPFLDRTVYTGWNGLCISAFLAAGRALALPEVTRFALQTLDRVLNTAWNPETGLTRVVAYPPPNSPTESHAAPQPIPAVLDDYVFLAHAALDGWEATGQWRLFEAAHSLAQHLLTHFSDSPGVPHSSTPSNNPDTFAGFFDTPQRPNGPAPLGVLRARRKPLQDAPTPAGNPVAASLLLRLHALTGDPMLHRRAAQTLATFAGVAGHLGLYAASYGLALRRLLTPPEQVVILGEGKAADALEAAALARYRVNKSIIRLRQPGAERLPQALAETLPHLPPDNGSGYALLCRGNTCHPPITHPDELLEVLLRD